MASSIRIGISSVVIACTVLACGGTKKSAPASVGQPAATSVPVASSASRVFMDPTTGEIRQPTQQEAEAVARELQARSNTSAQQVSVPSKIVTLPNGTVLEQLPQSAMIDERVCLDAKSRRPTPCTSDAATGK